MSNITNENYIQKLYEDLYEKHYQEVGKTTDDVGYIEKEAERLAEIDLEIRGEGTIMGISQKGKSDLKLASLRRDKEWVQHARDAAFALLGSQTNSQEISLLANELRLFFDTEEVEYLFKS